VEPLHVTPLPDEAEREAIRAALAAEEAERPKPSAWAATQMPARGDEDTEP
jgi:hypothetical protein